MGRLDGQVALVTGAGGAIGTAAALGLVRAGARVALTSRSPDRLAVAAAAVADASGAEVPTYVADFMDPSQVEALACWATETLGGVDVLVNNAGANSPHRSSATADAALDELFRINVTAGAILCRGLIPGMIERGGGTIVSVASFAVYSPGPLGGAAYAASKAALLNYMGSVNAEFRNRGIRACTVLPGEVDTPLLAQRPRPPTAEDRATMIGADDVADAIVFCAATPGRTLIEEISIRPTVLRDTTEDVRIALGQG
ncbi:MAG: SDR family NAD(P)-dependent oxidoreductase [Chloroflexi bacterium]|nr:SDR family NAD(P)-dependent oxidoreductase [Chloroflexota bacterium]